jgi:hypothetical protein
LQASSLVVTDCAVKVWKAEWIDAECDHWSGICIPIPERITSAIFDTEPDLVSPRRANAPRVCTAWQPRLSGQHREPLRHLLSFGS